MKNKLVKFILKIVGAVILLFIAILPLYFIWTKGAWKLFKSNYAGSYVYAETWSLNIKEQKLIQIIRELKNEKPQLFPPYECCPDTTRHSYWYHFTFYNKIENQELHIRVRGNENPNFTTIYFVSTIAYSDSLTPPKDIEYVEKQINHDFDYYENKAEIKKFEENILKPIQHKIDSLNMLQK
jgi:hypothetical protein